jgi:hypothetical protein
MTRLTAMLDEQQAEAEKVDAAVTENLKGFGYA